MDNKSNFTSNKTVAALSDGAKGPPPLNPVSSSDIRNEVDKATETVADVADDAKAQVGKAADSAQETVSRVAEKVQQTSQKAIDATRDYAAGAVEAAGSKVREVHGQYEAAKSTATDYINEDPVRAVTYAAIGSAVLTAALIGIFRRR